MSHSNTAAYLITKQQTPFSLASAPIPEPLGPYEVLIKVGAIAINPVDAAIQNLGILWDSSTYPLIVGSDLAGEVVKVGVGVKRFQVGDRVLACVESGAFQQYCVARKELVAKIPEHVSYKEASVLGLGMATAAVGLFQPDGMGLDHLPKVEASANGKIVLVWGGSSSVGSCAIQMLRAAGYEVVAVAGGSNKQYCMGLGAKFVFDHRSGDVEEEIVDGVHASGKEFAGVFSAIIDVEVLRTCVRIADQLGCSGQSSSIVGTVIPPDGSFPLPEVPDGVKFAFCKGPVDLLPESKLAKMLGWEERKSLTNVGPALFEEWMPAGLDSGQLKCMPQPFVVGHGLESLQEACDLMAKGVSAKKLVVVLD